MPDADVATLEQDMQRFAPCCHYIFSFFRHANFGAKKIKKVEQNTVMHCLTACLILLNVFVLHVFACSLLCCLPDSLSLFGGFSCGQGDSAERGHHS